MFGKLFCQVGQRLRIIRFDLRRPPRGDQGGFLLVTLFMCHSEVDQRFLRLTVFFDVLLPLFSQFELRCFVQHPVCHFGNEGRLGPLYGCNSNDENRESDDDCSGMRTHDFPLSAECSIEPIKRRTREEEKRSNSTDIWTNLHGETASEWARIGINRATERTRYIYGRHVSKLAGDGGVDCKRYLERRSAIKLVDYDLTG